MPEPAPIHTARLHLRPLAVADAADFYPIFQDAAAMRYWHTLPHADIGETHTMLEQMLDSGHGRWWALCRQGDGRALGFVGFHQTMGRCGFGYLVHPAHWRRGFATEAVRAALAYGFNQLKIEQVELWIHPHNIASLQLAHKLGFTNRGEFLQKFPGQATTHATQVFGLHAGDWPGTTPKPPPRDPACSFYSVQPILPVRDLEATLAYYQAQLGFGVDFVYGNPPTHAGVGRGDWSAHAVRIQLHQVDAGVTPLPGCELYFMVGGGIEHLYATYKAQGVQVVEALQAQPWGMWEFTIADCNGHYLRFGTPA